ncbi:MAG: transaldolase [Pyrinomonadaceae bacterium]|nr:transaldolase [Pyrinomonadaceae bacterium]
MANTEATESKKQNPLQELVAHGQSPWLDFISRKFIQNGELQKLVDDNELRGMTSNPSIFGKAIGESEDYDEDIKKFAPESKDAKDLYERLAIKDIQDACDILMPVYESSGKLDGCVSLEVAPGLAFNTEDTIEEARRLWKTVDRPNLMVKVPATPEGVPAITRLIAEGISVNVTLLFAQEAYRYVAEAYIAGLEERAANGENISQIASVASFFVSRIDSEVDKRLDEKIKAITDKPNAAEDTEELEMLKNLKGKAAIANAKMAYRIYEELFSGERWENLAKDGANPQRLLWASTGVKNPEYRDVLYIEQLVGKYTVNTIPPATFDAFREHGEVSETLTSNVEEAEKTLQNLETVGISLEDVTDKLLKDAVKLFVEPFEKMLATVEKARQQNN